MLQLSATKCSCISILWVSLVSFAAIILCVASQRCLLLLLLLLFISLSSQSGNFWIYPRIFCKCIICKLTIADTNLLSQCHSHYRYRAAARNFFLCTALIFATSKHFYEIFILFRVLTFLTINQLWEILLSSVLFPRKGGLYSPTVSVVWLIFVRQTSVK